MTTIKAKSNVVASASAEERSCWNRKTKMSHHFVDCLQISICYLVTLVLDRSYFARKASHTLLALNHKNTG
jgi:hypothetical protein